MKAFTPQAQGWLICRMDLWGLVSFGGNMV